VVQEGSGWNPWASSLFRASEINLHCLDSPEFGLQNDTIYIGCQMTSFDHHLGSAILNFTFFLKSTKITGIDTKSSQNAYYLYKLVDFWNLMKKTGKQTTELCQKKFIFGQTHMKLAVAMETSKMMDTQVTHQNICEG